MTGQRMLRAAIASLAVAAALVAAPAVGETPYELPIPRGFPDPKIPAENPLTWEKVELGRLLFYDTRLSLNQTLACASCHQQDKAFTDGREHSVGSTGDQHPRNAMSLANVVYNASFNWADPNTPSLEQQMLVPLFGENPVELGMGGNEDELFRRLQADTRYQRMFAEAFPGNPPDLISIRTITQAIASFERTLISGDSAFDRYTFGDDDAMSESAIRGISVFFDRPDDPNPRECEHCHAGFNLTLSRDHAGTIPEKPFHNTALYNLNCADEGLPDLDLDQCAPARTPGPGTPAPTPTPTCRPGAVCHRCDGEGEQRMGCYPRENTGLFKPDLGNTAEMGRFKAPTLRNIAVSGPYMHDGTVTTLDDVIDHYAAGGRTITEGPHAGSVGAASPAANAFMTGFQLTERQRGDLLAFFEALTDDAFLTNPRFSDPFVAPACPGDCNLDGSVVINELVTAMNVNFRTATLAICLVADPNGNGEVSIDELVRAIGNALNGCA